MSTTLHFLSATKRVGALCKQLGLADGTNKSYPLAAKMTVHEEKLDPQKDGLAGYRKLLVDHAKKGHALYKGVMKKKLRNESRRGQTDNDALTDFVVLDVDGLSLDVNIASPASPADVQKVAEAVIDVLPDSLRNVSYLAVASSSFGLDPDKLSVHIHFLLKSPVSHRQLKIWLDGLNYTQDEIYQRLTLTASRTRVKNVIDSCLGEPARLVYIAPPKFGPKQENPFQDDTDRIVHVKKGVELLDLDKELGAMHKREGVIRNRRETKRKECLKKAGLSTRQLKYKRIATADGGQLSVITNPPESAMFFAYDSDEFVRYNIGDKKNNAYYVRLDNPEVVFSFIPEEQPFLFHAADPQAYAAHIEKYGRGAAKVVNAETGETRKVVRDMFIEQTADKVVTVEYDPDNDELVSYKERRNLDVAEEWLKFHGGIVPDPIPPIVAIYDPKEPRTLFQKDDKTVVNTFQPPKYLGEGSATIERETWMQYGGAFMLKRQCPVIAEMVIHMLGDCTDMFEHFINWLAYIVQTRQKSEQAFFVHGEQGTGKGLFHKKVLRPLFGKYTVMNTLENLADDKFNDWLAEPLLVFIDEFNMKGSSNNAIRVGTKLKNYITEPRLQLRKMNVSMYEVDFFVNFIFGSNELDAFQMQDKRRITMCPKQKRMLVHRLETLKTHREAYNQAIEAELDYFAAFLKAFDYSTYHATEILITSARDEINEASMDAVTRFFDNLANGNFEPFIDLIDKPTDNMEPDEAGQLQLVRKFLIACIPHLNTGESVYLHKNDVRALYQYMSGKPITDVRFGRMLSTNEVPIKRSAYAVGHKSRFERRPKMIEVCWQLDDNEVVESLQTEFASINNTISITPKREASNQDKQRLEAEELLKSIGAS